MLTFYHHNEDTFSKWVTDKLEEMVVAHELIDAEESGPLPEDIALQDLPVLTDGHEIWSAQKDIKEFLEKLHQDLKLSQSLQSDACHIDPDNPDECL